MGEVIQFIPKSALERARLIQEARAIDESIFPTLNGPASQQRDSVALLKRPDHLHRVWR